MEFLAVKTAVLSILPNFFAKKKDILPLQDVLWREYVGIEPTWEVLSPPHRF